MASSKLKCRVCGKEYDACSSSRKYDGVFHWQEVACSPECGNEYLNRVLRARGLLPSNDAVKRSKRKTVSRVNVSDDSSCKDVEHNQ